MSLTTNCLIKYGSIASEKLCLKTLCIFHRNCWPRFSARIGSYAEILNILYTYMFRKHHESIKFWSDIKHKSRVVPEFLYWALISCVEEDWAHSWFPPLICKNSNRLPWGPFQCDQHFIEDLYYTLKCRHSCMKSCCQEGGKIHKNKFKPSKTLK